MMMIVSLIGVVLGLSLITIGFSKAAAVIPHR